MIDKIMREAGFTGRSVSCEPSDYNESREMHICGVHGRVLRIADVRIWDEVTSNSLEMLIHDGWEAYDD